MYPEICKIGPFTIYSYGLMLVSAFMVGLALVSIQAKRKNIIPDKIFNFAFIVFVSGIIGARIFYIIENLGHYLKSPLEIIMLQHGGLSLFGGLILGAGAGILYLKSNKVSVYKVLDLVSPFVALAQAIGRVGCLLNGCCFGKVSEFGVYFPVLQSIRIPTQIYSSLILILIFIILRLLQERPYRDGQIFFTYLFLYATKRFFMEFWRADHEVIFLGLSLFQIISIIIFCLALVKLIQIRKSSNRND